MSLRCLLIAALVATAIAGPVHKHPASQHHLATELVKEVKEPVVHETNIGRVAKLVLEAKVSTIKHFARLFHLRYNPDEDQELQVVPAAYGSPEELEEAIKAQRAKIWAGIATGLVSFVLFLGIVAGVTYAYKEKVALPELEVEKAKSEFEGQDFKHHFCNCFEDMNVCCCTFWCMACRWADTLNSVGIMSFYLAALLFIVVTQGAQLLGLLGWILAAVFFTYYRQQLRTKLGMVNERENQVKDFGMWCCCCLCAAVQEARQVKEAAKAQGVIEV